jgi:hypothetical protein
MENWQNLPKNQDDNETIEGAIDRKIAEHMANIDAHVLEGQSLQSHKSALVIDHLARSIVGDKINAIFTVLKPMVTGAVATYSFNYPECTLSIEGAEFEVNELIDRYLVIYTGVDAEMNYQIISNTATTLTIFMEEENGLALGDTVGITKAIFHSEDMMWALMSDRINAYNGEVATYGGVGSTIEIDLDVERIQIIGTKQQSGGMFNLYIDGVLDSVVDTYASAEFGRVLLYEKVFGTSANRTFKIEVLAENNALSSGNDVEINGFDANGVIYFNSLQFSIWTSRKTATTNSSGAVNFWIDVPQEYQIVALIGNQHSRSLNQTEAQPQLYYEPLNGQNVVRLLKGVANTSYTVQTTFLVALKDNPLAVVGA